MIILEFFVSLFFFFTLQLQPLLRASVSQVQVDECVHADCKTSGGCYTQLSISDSPTLIDSGALSLVSVKVTSSAVCGCAAREMTRQLCSTYPTNPCHNGGTCIDTQNGYRWEARRKLDFRWNWFSKREREISFLLSYRLFSSPWGITIRLCLWPKKHSWVYCCEIKIRNFFWLF